MKRFDDLFAELAAKTADADPRSGTVKLLKKGRHEIGKKLVEEACEAWMASVHENRDRTAQEISQLLYHAQVMMLACDLDPDDVYKYL
ncbi:MAG: phosphoribosyl-ATP diphosphatase [Desulfobacteraceae bacterium]|nr:phosphoribosyl-ATP diphosphatase [Desulfobacteraceae bacterium]